MRKIVFVDTGHFYPSYADFWHLVRSSSFPVVGVGEIDWFDEGAVYIITPYNGYFPFEAAQSRRCKFVHWKLEPPDQPPDNNVSALLDTYFDIAVDAVWVSDRFYASMDPRFTYVLFGSDKSLQLTEPSGEPDLDVTCLMYVTPRRGSLLGQMEANGVKFCADGIDFGPARDAMLHRNRIVMNSHQRGTIRVIGPQRFAMAAAYKMPVVSESVADSFPFVHGEHGLFVPYDGLVSSMVSLLKDRGEIARMGQSLHDLLCEKHAFRAEVEKAVEALR